MSTSHQEDPAQQLQQPFSLRGSTVLVTGGARRVGRVICRRLFQAGATLLIHAHRSVDEARALAAELSDQNRSSTVVQADLASHEELEALTNLIRNGLPIPIQAMVHAASPYGKVPLAHLTPADLDRYYAVHLRAPVFLAQALQHNLRGREGRIVHITDASLRRPYPGYTAYLSTKQALEGLTRALAVELAPTIRVNSVAPGTVLPPDDCSPAYSEALVKQSPLKMPGHPEDVAQAVEFLLKDRGFITGTTLTVDGGACIG
jgi:pteridine reductase